ncbi:hypothetical protein EOM86_15170 [Candidatus Nomurabacteria bacterium]|nr:hypothetical protein [Candidatus Nomurabacteria bacterium]
MKDRKRFAVPGCINHNDQGPFVGDVCSPCYSFLTGVSGGQYSQAAKNGQDRLMLIQEVMNCYAWAIPFINRHGELIVYPKDNIYLNCTTVFSRAAMENKVVSWLSRPCTKDQTPKVMKQMGESFNRYLGTEFTLEDLNQIYTYFGNDANEEWRKKFVDRRFDMAVITELQDSRKGGSE